MVRFAYGEFHPSYVTGKFKGLSPYFGTMKRLITILCIFGAILQFIPLSAGTSDPLLGIRDVRVNDDESFFDQGKADWFVTEQGYIYLVWEDFRETYWSIFFSRSFNGGRTWGDGDGNNNNDINVVDDPTGLYSHRDPSIAMAPNTTLYVFWQDSREGVWRIYYSFSKSGGMNWSASQPLGGPAGNQTEVISRVVNRTIWVCWLQEIEGGTGVYMTHINGSGVPEGFFRVDNASSDKSGLFMAASVNKVSIFWEENGEKRNIRWTTLTEEDLLRGEAGEVDELVEPPATGYVADPFASYDPYGNLLVIFEEESYGMLTVHYMVIYPDGVRAGPYRVRTPPLNVSYQADPSIVADSRGNIYFFWAVGEDVDHLIKGGWTSRVGDEATDVMVMDWTIMMGPRPTEPQYTYSMMVRGETSAFLVRDEPMVLWEDSRDDPNPSKPEPENSDIYVNRYPRMSDVPPKSVNLTVGYVGWNRTSLRWERSMDLDFSSYNIYLSTQRGFTPGPAFEVARIGERGVTHLNITGLQMNTTYYVRLGVEDAGGNINFSSEVSFTTLINRPPRITLISPTEEVTVDRELQVLFSVFDPDDNAEVTLYLRRSGAEPPGEVVGEFLEGESGLIEYALNTSSLSNGTYLLQVVASDGVNPPVRVNFPLITVHHPPPEPPKYLNILSVTPAPGSMDISLRTIFRVVFSREVDPGTIDSSTVLLKVDDAPKQAELRLLEDNVTLLIDPGYILPPHTDCSLTLLEEIRSSDGWPLDGKGLGAPSSATFTYRTRADDKRPEVLFHSPIGVMVPPEERIVIEFSTWIDISTVKEGVKLLKEGEVEVSFTFTYDRNISRLTLHPSQLDYSTTYRVIITRELLGMNGLPATEFWWNFTTLPYSFAPDRDHDGYPDPLDAFPDDPSEWIDTDLDGIGDNSDNDDDGDGIPDKWELEHGLNPLLDDAEEDPDGDGYTNIEEYRSGTDPVDPSSHPGAVNWMLWGAVLVLITIGAVVILAVIVRRKESERGWE